MAAIVTDSISLPDSNISPNDFISTFPNDIRQKILCPLTLKQRAVVSLVSQKWHHMITSLDDSQFVQKDPTNRYCSCNQSLNLRACRCFYRVKVIKLATDKKNFTEFYLSIRNFQYFLDMETIKEEFLTILHLKGNCNMNRMGKIKKFPYLKELYLDSVSISGRTFSKLIKKCPSIVELTLIDCSSLNSITVPDLNQLEKVHVNCGIKSRRSIEIKARNLREFHLFSSSIQAMRLDLSDCTNLQVLNMDCGYIPDGFPQEVCSAFPSLKSLSLRSAEGLNKIKIMSRKMESVSLIDIVDLDDAIVVTPNLHSFKITDDLELPSTCVVVGSKLLEIEIGLKNACATNKLIELRNFTEYLGENITLFLETDTIESQEVVSPTGDLRSKIEPLCIKHINLEILISGVSRYESLIHELFSYFHPRTLLVRENPDALNCNFIQVLLDELKDWEKEVEGGKRYKYSNQMCWRYSLKSFNILESTTTQLSLEFQWRAHYRSPP